MIQYLPWSEKVYNDCLNNYYNNSYSILDIELGGQCNCHCIYCDSPNRQKKCSISIEKIKHILLNYEIQWVFICGLGEPTSNNNLPMLISILEACEENGVKCSLFTNLFVLNQEVERFLQNGVLNILFKYDTLSVEKARNIYGITNSKVQIENISRIKKFVTQQQGHTNIAASIVPTQINKNEIISIVNDCLSSGIYPLIAELENSGDAQEYYSELSLSKEELIVLKNAVNNIIGEEYIVPVCPSVICGIHVRNDGLVTVDKYTGLSCHWFWLEEPKTHIISNFNTCSYNDIVRRIDQYRNEKIGEIKEILINKQESVFGGCGGNAISLLSKYISVIENRGKK